MDGALAGHLGEVLIRYGVTLSASYLLIALLIDYLKDLSTVLQKLMVKEETWIVVLLPFVLPATLCVLTAVSSTQVQ